MENAISSKFNSTPKNQSFFVSSSQSSMKIIAITHNPCESNHNFQNPLQSKAQAQQQSNFSKDTD